MDAFSLMAVRKHRVQEGSMRLSNPHSLLSDLIEALPPAGPASQQARPSQQEILSPPKDDSFRLPDPGTDPVDTPPQAPLPPDQEPAAAYEPSSGAAPSTMSVHSVS